MKKFITILTVFMIFHSNSNAQAFTDLADKFLIGYNVAFPTNDFLSKTSWAGGKIEYRHMLKHNLSVGLAGSWNSFEEYVPRTTYQKPDGSGAITSDVVRDLYSVPITLNVHYYFESGNTILPYAGIGMGTQFSDQSVYFNIYGLADETWGFVAQPEVGLIYPFKGSYTALYLSAVYNYASNKSDIMNTNNLSHFALTLGFVFSSR
jgi:outer membrane protein W